MSGAAEQLSLTLSAEQIDALTPLKIIRTESVLSKLPVHNLAKKGKVDIRILRKSSQGDVHLKWEVSYNDRYGQPRQLAYKLDTLIVNKRIDDSPRPLPVLIRIGSLKDVCRSLGVQESGKNVRDVRNAFLQNASAFINAKFTYKTIDGTEKHFEAGFSRYGVVFTGEKLPDGREADAVYITLNQPYWEVVNSAPFRPLNYDYLRELTPAAQRFYEIISFRIFAALRNNGPVAKISYSEYCAYSAQQRYFDHEHFRVQMYKIHRPHLQSGYLEHVEVQPGTDGEGKADWMLFYTPGSKARVEFNTFTRKQRDVPWSLPADSAHSRQPREIEPRSNPDMVQGGEKLRALVERGITRERAQRLLKSIPEEQPVIDQLEWGDFLIGDARSGKFKNPPGFYFSLIRDDIRPPATFETSRQRRMSEQAQRAATERETCYAKRELIYKAYCEQETTQAFESHPADEIKQRLAVRRNEVKRRFPNLLAQTLDEIALHRVRRDIAEGLQVMSLKEFCQTNPEAQALTIALQQ